MIQTVTIILKRPKKEKLYLIIFILNPVFLKIQWWKKIKMEKTKNKWKVTLNPLVSKKNNKLKRKINKKKLIINQIKINKMPKKIIMLNKMKKMTLQLYKNKKRKINKEKMKQILNLNKLNKLEKL